MLVGSVTADEPSVRRGNAHVLGCRLGREQIPSLNAKSHVDTIETQRAIVCSVRISRENYDASVLLLAFREGVWLCRQLMPPDGPEQAFLAKVGISSRSAYWWLCRRRHKHQLRHAHVVELLHEGIPLPLIQRQLGHSHSVDDRHLPGGDQHRGDHLDRPRKARADDARERRPRPVADTRGSATALPRPGPLLSRRPSRKADTGLVVGSCVRASWACSADLAAPVLEGACSGPLAGDLVSVELDQVVGGHQ